MATFATGALLSLSVAAATDGWSSCDLGDLRIENDFPTARANACFRQSADEVAVLIMPEVAGIIRSPWYAFRVTADKPRRVRATLVYGEGAHRYWPKTSHDGKTWQRLPQDRVHVAEDGATATLELRVGPDPVWVAAQELWPAERYADWLSRLSGRDEVSVSLLGWSGQRRPIRILRSEAAGARAGTVVLVGRQHPPEIPGAFALQRFVETLLDDGELSRRFRERFRLVVVPELNPDGVAMGHWRQNADGADINRDWGPFAQQETRLMRDLLASLAREPSTRPRIFLDFHSTLQDVFYTQFDADPVDPPLFEQRWLKRLQERMPDYVVNRNPVYQAGRPTAKTWVYETYRIPAVTFEIGDETPRDLIATLAQEAARAMMETLLDDGAVGEGEAQATKDLAAGDGEFLFDSWAGPPVRVWYHRPETVTPTTPVLFVMHGVKRDADRYRDEWSAIAAQRGFMLVVPEFSDRDFPGGTGYNLGFVLDDRGHRQPRERWSFSVIESLFDAVRAMTGTRVETYDLYGHSAGAQFVHRYLMFVPEARVGRAIAANAGWYTMPDTDVEFPYGLGASGVSESDLRRALGRRLTVLLGTDDAEPQHPNLRRTPEAMTQGPHRLARGEFFFGSAAAAAAALGTDFRWTLEKVEGVGHDNGAMAGAAAALLDD